MHVIPAELENCLQPNLQHPSSIHPKRMDFERDYQKRGFLYVMKKYGGMGWRSLFLKNKRIIRNCLGKFKRGVKRIMGKK